ncbi:MAG TPA: hypothetical protein VFF42_02640 [Candidatus Eremiobacteraceae bacterium]|nr:hypothetical protein [Candidatus Eremiobacteraceae bacterium]
MLTPNQVLRLFVEFIFVLLGAMLLWLDVSGKLFVDRYSWSWLALSAAMLFWGARALVKPGKNWAPGERWIRGASLLLLGVVMLVTSRVPFVYVRAAMATVAVILILRGLAGAGLALRAR